MRQQGEQNSCGVEKECGACQHVGQPYALQLADKDERIRSLFEDAGLTVGDMRSIIGMDDPYHYRNKVISPFAPGRNADVAFSDANSGAGDAFQSRSERAGKLRGKGVKSGRRANQGKAERGARRAEILTGMYAAHSHRLVRTDDCLLENEQAKAVIQAIRSIMVKHNMAPYNEDTGTGFVRHAVVRVGHNSGEVLVTVVTNGEEFPASKSFCKELLRRCPFVTAVVQNVNTRRTNVILGQKEKRLYGPGFILDTLCGLSFRISAQSFYQVNAVQTEVLYEQAMALARLDDARTVIDAYCGTGTIGLVAACRGNAQVIGVDSVESAIRDARENARHNNVENTRFVVGDAGAFMREYAAGGEQAADVVFMDPPRAGSSEQFLDALVSHGPSRVVYVSCNPATLVRDLSVLTGRGYGIEVVQPVDMFPHTDHIETVVSLSRRSS